MYDKYIFREICVFRKRSIVDRYDSTGHVCYIPQLVLRSRVVYKKNYFLSYSGILCRIAKKIFLLDFEVERKYSYRHSVPNFELQYNYATPNRSFKITCKFKKEQKMNKKIMPF